MRFFSTVFVAVAALASFVSAQSGSGNPITSPTAGDRLNAGSQTTIVWTPTTPKTDTIKLTLRRGDENNLNSIQTITTSAPNSGSFTWDIPASTVAGTDYTIEITWSNGVNYSPRFEIRSSVTASSSSTRASSTTTSSVSSSTATTSALTSSITSAPNGTTLSTTTRTPRTTSTGNDTEEDSEIPRNSGSHSAAVGSFAMLACIAGAMVYLA